MNVQQITGEGNDYRQVRVVIGGDGKEYKTELAHFDVTGVWRGSIGSSANRMFLMILLPDSVAEYFRQQGRRQLQSEMRILLNVPRS